MKIKTFIGIDVSKNWLDLFVKCADQSEYEFRITNTLSHLSSWEKQMKRKKIALNASAAIFFETTGIYTRVLQQFAAKKTCKVYMESSLRIKRSMGIARGKSDRIDAKRIALYGMRHYNELKSWQPLRPVIKDIRQLLINQRRIKKIRDSFLIPLKELKAAGSEREAKLLTQLNRFAIQGLSQSLDKTTARIDQLIGKDKKISHYVTLLTSIPNIGKIIALNFIAATNEFKLHTNARTLACYAGIAPFEYSSGKSVKGRTRIDPAANKKLKALLHLAAISSIRHSGVFRKYFDRKVKEGKHKLAVLNAIRNKLVKRIAAVIQRDSPYVKESLYRKQMPPTNQKLNQAGVTNARR